MTIYLLGCLVVAVPILIWLIWLAPRVPPEPMTTKEYRHLEDMW